MNIKASFSGGIKAIAMQGAEAAPIKGVIHAASAIRAELSEEEGIRAEMKTGGYVKGLDGKSAYQIALENGFEGTEEEWLASLKGEPGQADAEQVEQIITDYLEKNPIEGVTPEQVEQAVESALQQAKESGAFDGEKGDDGGYYSPSVDDSGILTWEASKAGMPAVSAADIKGKDGYTPIKGKDYFDGEPGYTPVKGIDYFDGKQGDPGYTPQKGIDYYDGQDGISPTVSVQDISGGHRVTITDKDGEKTFDVMDGKNGTGGGASVQADWAVNDESDPAFVKNRTHYEYQAFDIRWDGDKTGKFALDMSMLGYDQGMYFVKVSDAVLSAEEVIGATAENVGFGSFTVTENMIDMASFPGAMSVNNNVISVQDQSMLNAALGTPDGYITNGTYFYMYETYGYYVARFAAKPDVVEIPVKFLPKNLFDAAQSNWNENDPKSTAYVQNRTHYEYRLPPIVWEKGKEMEDTIDASALGLGIFKKISDDLFPEEYRDEIDSPTSGAYIESERITSEGLIHSNSGLFYESLLHDETIGTIQVYHVNPGVHSCFAYVASVKIAADLTDVIGINIPSTGTYICVQENEYNEYIKISFHRALNVVKIPRRYRENVITLFGFDKEALDRVGRTYGNVGSDAASFKQIEGIITGENYVIAKFGNVDGSTDFFVPLYGAVHHGFRGTRIETDGTPRIYTVYIDTTTEGLWHYEITRHYLATQ